ncbi:hypothetical protein WA026_004792 [Henosepilachna vigintioctopunctata]|uniref:Uncharacterized protein n=1 Tax=Henosepilachna vigintioctopunctata TaxID=420089 RepID=A0AAW1V1C4_9CUCU
MFRVVFISLFALQSTHANYLFPSSWRNTPNVTNLTKTDGAKAHTAPEAKMYFESFSLNKLNPAYWFYDSTEDDKVEELYNLVRCMIEDEHSLCKKKLQSARRLFEKKKKGDKKGSTTTNANHSVDHHEDSGLHKKTKPTEKNSLPKKTTTSLPEVSDKFQSESSTAGSSQKKTTEITTPTEDTVTTTISATES